MKDTRVGWCKDCRGYHPVGAPHGGGSVVNTPAATIPSLFDVEPERDFAPGRTRTDDYATSKAGAVSVSYRAGSQKALLLAAYRAAPGGLTDEEAAKAAGVPIRSCWWKRCNELREASVIVPTGATRTGDAGVPRIVCRASEGV